MVGGARGRERDELAQAPERDEGEEDDGRDFPGEEGHGEDRDHRPPAVDARCEVGERARVAAAPGEEASDERRDREEGEQAQKKPRERMNEKVSHLAHLAAPRG